MGVMEGLVGGFGKAYGAHQKEAAARTAKQGELEQSILSQLLGSTNTEVQMRAMQAMIQGAGGKAKKKGGISGFLGETEPSPEFTGMFDYLKGLDKGKAREPDTVTDTVEGGVPTQTITAAPEGTPTTLFETPQQQREAEAALAPAARPPTRQTQVISTDKGQFLVDSQTGTVIEEYAPRAGEQASAVRGTFMEDERGQHIVDPTTGEIIASFGPKPATAGEGAPRDRPDYLNARASLDQIEAALEAKYGKSWVEMADVNSPDYQQMQQDRDALAVQYGWPSFAELQRNAAKRRGELGMGMPPSAEQGIQGQGADVDHQRMAEIEQAAQGGTMPSPKDQEFIRQYLEMYGDQLMP